MFGGDKLELRSPLLGHPLIVLFGVLVVEDMEVHRESHSLEALYHYNIGCQILHVFSRLEGLNENHVRQVVGHHHALVAASHLQRKLACVISVQRVMMKDGHVELVRGRAVKCVCGIVHGGYGTGRVTQ